MKALTLWQPWASAIAIGEKLVETRSWSTNHRGPLAIHAAAGPIRPEGQALLGELLDAIPDAYFGDPIPSGAVVAIAQLVDVVPTERCLLSSPTTKGWERWGANHVILGEAETRWGDYSPQRFAWLLHDVRWLNDPIPARGHQQLWNWSAPAELEESARV